MAENSELVTVLSHKSEIRNSKYETNMNIKIQMSKNFISGKNESEKFFEQYLNLNGFSGKWTYELSIEGKNKTPDYELDFNGKQYFFEVKELRKKPDEPNFPAFINPYKSLRNEIHGVRRQFKEYKDYSCSLVVFNIDDGQARLDPLHVYGAMLGNLGLEMDYNSEKGKVITNSARNVYGKGGKMIDYKNSQSQNTTINAVIVLDKFIDNREIEKIRIRMGLYESHPVKVIPRVIVIENPFAKISFPSDLFCGHFDEHWRIRNNRIKRTFVGTAIREIESFKNNR